MDTNIFLTLSSHKYKTGRETGAVAPIIEQVTAPTVLYISGITNRFPQK